MQSSTGQSVWLSDVSNIENTTVMKTKLYYLAAIAAMAVSCNSLVDGGGEDSRQNQVRIGVPDGAPTFSEGDRIGLYMISTASSEQQPISAERRYSNVPFVMTGGKFVSDPESTFPEDENIFNSIFIYSPYRSEGIPEGGSDIVVEVGYDQKTDMSASDLMFGVLHGYKPSSKDPEITMRHAMSLLSIRLRPGEGFNSASDLGNPTVVVKGRVLEGKFDFSTVVPLDGAEEYDVIPNGFFTEKDGVLEGVSAALIPQAAGTSEVFLEIEIDGVVYEFVPSREITFESGKNTEVTLTVNRGFDGVSVNIDDLRIMDWETVEESVILDELTVPEGNTVTDIDGNEYPIVRIGQQYWMAANLRVTRLNDGTPITKNDKQLSEWGKYDSPAYVAYNFDESKVAKYGYLYNKYNVYSEKICPPGWSVPSATDWNILCTFLGGTVDNLGNWKGVGKALKSAEWSPGTNSSGFNGLPGGLVFAVTGDAGTSVFQGFGNEGNWWSFTGRYTMTLGSGNDLERYLTSDVCGASIRCIYNRKPIK